jgi:hypothetical protein
MMRVSVLLCGLVLSSTLVAQKSPVPAVASKRLSHYMQETGLLYLETTKKMMAAGLENPDAMQMLDPTEPSEANRYGGVLQEMEDHIQINISSTLDKQFLRLLQRTKATAELAVFGDPSMMYADCYVIAHETALRGTLSIGDCTEKKYEDTAKVVRDARLQKARDDLEKAKQHLADVQNGVPTLTPAQKELCAKDASFSFCAGTPEAGAKFEADKKAKTEELCAKGVFDKDYCAKFKASHTTSPTK